MKEATGELNMTVITVVAIAAVGLLFTLFVWPNIQANLAINTACANVDNNGNYNWDFNKLGAAHNWCKANVKLDMLSGKNVIVSNTNLTPKERKPYLDLAKEFGYTVEVITCNGGFQNIHGVSEESLERMRKRFIPFSENELL
jgi:hypothetical protein